MTKIEEELASIREVKNGYICEMAYYEDWDIISIMKSYAESYARRCLELAIEKVQVNHLSDESPNCKLIVKSIDRMKLPEHE